MKRKKFISYIETASTMNNKKTLDSFLERVEKNYATWAKIYTKLEVASIISEQLHYFIEYD